MVILRFGLCARRVFPDIRRGFYEVQVGTQRGVSTGLRRMPVNSRTEFRLRRTGFDGQSGIGWLRDLSITERLPLWKAAVRQHDSGLSRFAGGFVRSGFAAANFRGVRFA